MDRLQLILYVALWTVAYLIFIELEFGVIFLIVSMLIGIYLNTGNRKRKDGEPSAYSVFNSGCERIDGTLTAEQFENEILYKNH